jgi:hypothetical protein
MKRIRKGSTFCEYFRRSAEIVISRMRAVFLHCFGKPPKSNTRIVNSVYVLFCAFKMFKMIERPADCEIRSVIRDFNARNVKLTDMWPIGSPETSVSNHLTLRNNP